MLDFIRPSGAIVYAANKACLGNGDVGRAINVMGGLDLARDQRALVPLIAGE